MKEDNAIAYKERIIELVPNLDTHAFNDVDLVCRLVCRDCNVGCTTVCSMMRIVIKQLMWPLSTWNDIEEGKKFKNNLVSLIIGEVA